jgi:hypothetical protein
MQVSGVMRPMRVYFLTFLTVAASCRSFGDVPSWAKKNTTKKSGSLLTAVCEGLGPSVTLARKEAINNCQVSAKQFLNNEIKVKTLSVETEYSVGFHQEVEESGSVRNLVCNPKRDEVIEKDGQYQIWLECKFDLSKAKVESGSEKKSKEVGKNITSGLNLVKPAELKETDYDHQTIFLESIPQCESIIIIGAKSKTIPCSSNPMKVIIEDTDKEIIIRAKNFRPKTVPIQKGAYSETLQVFLERN